MPSEPSLFDRDFWAYVLPYGLLLLSASLAGEIPPGGYPAWYAATIVVVFGTWCGFRKHYPPVSTRGGGLALLAGLAGVVIWLALSLPRWETTLLGWLPDWLYSGERIAFNPVASIPVPEWRWAFLACRLFGLAVVVPLVEETFWRGFLSRYLVSDNWRAVPIGTWTPFSFAAVTVLFALVHVELVAAVVWGVLINLLLHRTRNLWACILMHAVTNLLLGVYILQTGAWWLW